MQVCLTSASLRFSLSTTSAHAQQQLIKNADLPSETAVKLTAMATRQGSWMRTASKKVVQAGSPTMRTNKVPEKTYYDARHQPFPDAVVTIHSRFSILYEFVFILVVFCCPFRLRRYN